MDDPLTFHASCAASIISLPVPSGGTTLATGGSPVLLPMPDGRIVHNAANSGSVRVNESGASTGTWKQYRPRLTTGLRQVPRRGR
ncbi:hypothetical protein J2X68_002766 [Streptomyces sp. 3330]|uniref:hypothetical protein n=1 Tax=Streptomyces sp. 3330 TaxID=2817755 RepID=UPI0028651A7E|nr:hypothetical protein [Streptomyces sp. 3330]MDR6976078.1 hypothetical protein [Streptomyces sp. 3330]